MARRWSRFDRHDDWHATGTTPEILHDIRIVDLTDGIAGSIATLLLAEAGADVVMVEPPDGQDQSLGTRVPHLGPEQAQRRRSTSRRPRVAATLDQLLAAADVLVHNFGRRARAELALDDESLARTHPDLIGCSVLSWPANHVDADRPVDELLAMARLGVLDEQMGYRDGPVFLRFPIGNWSSAYLLAIGIVDAAAGARALGKQRTGAHEPRPGRAGPDGDALAARGDAVALAAGGECRRATPWRRCSSAPTACGSTTWAEPSSRR